MSVAAVVIFLLAVCAANMERDRWPLRLPNESNEERCEASRGSCIPRRECLDHSNIIAFFCGRPRTVCCMSKKHLCENIYNGFCTNDISDCQPEETRTVSELRCDRESVCCMPVETLRLRQNWGGAWNARAWGGCRNHTGR